MGLFTRRTRPEPSADLLSEIRALKQRIERLETDWDLQYEKFQRLAARLAKRARDAEERTELTSEPPNGDGRPEVRNPLARRLLGMP